MALAVIKTGGKQYIVSPGQKLEIELLKGKKEGDRIDFEEVLLREKDGKVEIGQPYLNGVKVTAKVIAVGRGKKITILKYKSKTRYKLKKGHRQSFMRVEIEKIS
jgi:large subunit ribosomal protein L21